MVQAAVTPWSLRAWPPLLWQSGRAGRVRFRHLGTRIVYRDDGPSAGGQTVWGASSDDGEVGVAWDWIHLPRGVVAMADPMSVVTNLQLLGDAGEVLTAWEAARFLNQIVHTLPWQMEVERALATPTSTARH
jgi:hypothetical protein